MSVLILAALLSAVLVRVMIGVGTLDYPTARSSHALATPKGGGIGIVAAFALGIVWGADRHSQATIILPAALLVALVSYLDDLRNWPFLVKLAAQAVAAALVITAGIRVQIVHLPWFGALDTGALGVPITAAWILFVTNAVNFIDGLNGLASGSAAIAGLVLAAGAPAAAGPALLLVAGVAGFLPFNYPRARIFMGDVGSQFCGFILAVLGVEASAASGRPASTLLVPLVLSPILFDVSFTLARRAWQRDRLTEAHRSHLYQIAHRTGLPAWKVTLIYWAMAGWGGACALAMQDLPTSLRAAAPLSVLPPFILWGAWVARRANRSGIARW